VAGAQDEASLPRKLGPSQRRAGFFDAAEDGFGVGDERPSVRREEDAAPPFFEERVTQVDLELPDPVRERAGRETQAGGRAPGVLRRARDALAARPRGIAGVVRFS